MATSLEFGLWKKSCHWYPEDPSLESGTCNYDITGVYHLQKFCHWYPKELCHRSLAHVIMSSLGFGAQNDDTSGVWRPWCWHHCSFVPAVIASSFLFLFFCFCFSPKKRWEDNIREWTSLEFVKSQMAVEKRKIEETGCEDIFCALTTAAVKG